MYLPLTILDRGEAANHGLLDAYLLMEAVVKMYSGDASQQVAINEFETEMRVRTSRAVRLSRQACYDAHDWTRLDETSAILTKRAIAE